MVSYNEKIQIIKRKTQVGRRKGWNWQKQQTCQQNSIVKRTKKTTVVEVDGHGQEQTGISGLWYRLDIEKIRHWSLFEKTKIKAKVVCQEFKFIVLTAKEVKII